MAQGRSAGYRWQGDAPADGNSSRRDYFTDSGQHLHHVLDLWFHEVVKWHTTGEACLIRYADDFVCAFQNQDEAQHFFGALEHRLESSGFNWPPPRAG